MKTSKSKVLRKAWPKVRPYVKHGKTYYVIDLRRKHYTGPKLKWLADREAALRFAADIRLKMPVVIKCKFTSPISLCFFLVCRRAHLSQYRLKHGQFNESELARITKALGARCF